MLKTKKNKIIKALTMTALLAKGGICADGDKKETRTTQGPHGSTYTAGSTSGLTDSIQEQLSLIDSIEQARRESLRQPRIIDLIDDKSFDKVRNILTNARIYGARVKLTVNDIYPNQLNEILTNHAQDIQELDWAYHPASFISTGDVATETSTPLTATPTEVDDEDDDFTDLGNTPPHSPHSTGTPTGTDDEDDDFIDLGDTPTTPKHSTKTPTDTDDEDDDFVDLGDTPTKDESDTHKSNDSMDKRRLIENQLRILERQTQERREILRQPRIIDLTYASFDNVRSFLVNAGLYDARAILTVNGISEAQLHELLTNYAQNIEELDWAYHPASFKSSGDDDLTHNTEWTTSDEDEEETPTGFKTGDWDNNYIALGKDVRPRARRLAARGRDPLRLDDLRINLGQNAELDPIHKLLIDLNAEPAVLVAANDDKDPEKMAQAVLKWAATLIKDEKSDANTSGVEKVKNVQPHALVKMFCRGIKA